MLSISELIKWNDLSKNLNAHYPLQDNNMNFNINFQPCKKQCITSGTPHQRATTPLSEFDISKFGGNNSVQNTGDSFEGFLKARDYPNKNYSGNEIVDYAIAQSAGIERQNVDISDKENLSPLHQCRRSLTSNPEKLEIQHKTNARKTDSNTHNGYPRFGFQRHIK